MYDCSLHGRCKHLTAFFARMKRICFLLALCNECSRRKCVGRLRKQVADYTLLTGLASLALDAYQSAIEYLKQTNDFLWLAGTYIAQFCWLTIIFSMTFSRDSFFRSMVGRKLQAFV